MVPHAAERQRMEHLQEQGADAADQHGTEVAMHLPACRVRPEQAGIALGRLEVDPAEGKAGQAEHLAFDVAADGFHGLKLQASSGKLQVRAGKQL
ncbi:hypothetical protein D9M71_792020 [compost metagenome]